MPLIRVVQMPRFFNLAAGCEDLFLLLSEKSYLAVLRWFSGGKQQQKQIFEHRNGDRHVCTKIRALVRILKVQGPRVVFIFHYIFVAFLDELKTWS